MPRTVSDGSAAKLVVNVSPFVAGQPNASALICTGYHNSGVWSNPTLQNKSTFGFHLIQFTVSLCVPAAGVTSQPPIPSESASVSHHLCSIQSACPSVTRNANNAQIRGSTSVTAVATRTARRKMPAPLTSAPSLRRRPQSTSQTPSRSALAHQPNGQQDQCPQNNSEYH